MTDGKLLCLNMIVRNETANLERCLAAVVDHIACWVIGDTGSTDGTPDFIRSFFAARGVPGELHSFPFETFEQARNAALDRAEATPLAYDYLLLADADMELVVEDRDFRAGLEAPGYLLIQRAHSGLTYWNTRLVRRNLGARYHGVTHEYLDVPGGVKELRGAWYRDHATGANRVDKFDRDIRLLTAALEQEPEASRYWYYLAQSYRDAGQTAEAAKAYAKRAEMGGWDEEAWNARLQQARCLRTLGDEGGFLSQALAAFNQRPKRAEPLYDLARFYRERGMNEASVLFAEAGLALPRPDGDILFLEDSVYGWGLQEEYSIAANYSRDAARKDRGHAACNWLALDRAIPAGPRNLARTNLLFYIMPAAAMMPSFEARPVGFAAPDGYRPMNPSVARQGDEIVVVQRCVNFTLAEDGDYRTPDGGPIRTRNFLLRLADDLAIRSATEILPPADLPEPAYGLVQGFEDLRPFAWRGGLWCCAALRQLTPEGWCEQVLARIDDGAPGGCRLTDWRVLRPAGPRLHEKNWMPQVAGDTLRLVYRCDPTRVVDEQARTVAETTPAIAADHFSGGSQLIAFEGGWLALIHETKEGTSPGRRQYQHRFVWFDGTSALRRVSRAFFFRQKGIEYAAGLAWHPDGKRLLITYGVGDAEAWIATVDAAEVGGLLEDAQQLPSGAPGSGGGAARPRAVPGETASRAEGSARPIAKAARSAWVPAAPAAGTELMVAGLRQRLGGELDTIALTVNHPGPVTGDARPRVVWVHHDTDQDDVQWCRDRALVGSVDCFVFVSYWQRERYLAAFGLPPEHCVVLHNATDVDATPRPWAPGPIWRCAYTSTPFRGLDVLLDAWERLRPSAAELHVWSSMKLYLADDGPYLDLYERAESLPGVIYHGVVPNAELRAALQTIDFLTYPSTFAETSCLAVIEAMAAGCRVIVPSLGALPETTCGYAHVYPYSDDPTAHAALFADALRQELARPWAGAPEVAWTQQRHCAVVYDWRSRIAAWRQLIGSVAGKGRRPREQRGMTGDAAMPRAKAIGLSMIVKNEAHVIVRCLESVRRLVDYVLVEDTGSTDDTREIVHAWLRDTGTPGEVIEEKWRDFGHNRSVALAALRRRPDIDYALVIDADDVVAYEPGFDAAAFKAGLTADLYNVELRLRDVVYQRPQLCSNRIDFLYRGVLHEFIDTPDGTMSFAGGQLSIAAAEGFHMLAGLQGARNIDPKKYRGDIDILQRALKSEGNKFLRSRYTFYLAQSLRDAGEAHRALKAFEQRGEMGFWHEERAISLYNAAELKAQLGHPASEVIGTYLEAYEASPARLEALHGAVRFCRGKEMFRQGYVIAKGAMALPPEPPKDGLFVQRWIYDYGMLDELSVVAYWSGQYQDCVEASEQILAEAKIPDDQRDRISANAMLASEKLEMARSARDHGLGPRYAVVTPYFKESRSLIERCINSVRGQTIKVDHLLIADGHPQGWIDHSGVRHIRLDRSHSDYGNSPRAVGCLLAASEGYQGIALLDADNWFEADHVERCLEAASRAEGDGCDYVIAKRNLTRIDGSLLPIGDEPVQNHVDTNCFFFLPGSFHLLSVWALMPRPLTIVGDRAFYLALRSSSLVAATTDKVTVNYLCLWDVVYEAAGEVPPAAKPNPDHDAVINWIDELTPRDRDIANRLIQANVDHLYDPGKWPPLHLASERDAGQPPIPLPAGESLHRPPAAGPTARSLAATNSPGDEGLGKSRDGPGVATTLATRPRIRVKFSLFEPGWPEFPSKFDSLFPTVQRNYELHRSDQPQVLFYSCFSQGNLWRSPDGRSLRLMPTYPPADYLRVFVTGENIEPIMEACDYAISFSTLIDHPNHLHLPLWAYEPRTAGLSAEMLVKPADMDWEKLAGEKTKFCNFVYSNDVVFRNQIFTTLNVYKQVDAPGHCMNNMSSRSVRGGQMGKIGFLRPYKFTLAVENFIWPGYTTEKLVHPMFAGSIPIYIGDPLAGKIFNTASYIDLNCFASLREMFEFVREVDNNRNLYLDMLAAPFYRGNQVPDCARDEAIHAFFDRIFTAALARQG